MHISRRGSKDFLKSQSITKKRRKKKILKLWVGVFLIACIVFGLSWATTLERFSLKNVVVVGNIHTTSTEIQTIVESMLQQKYAGLFSKKNVFFVPKHEITEILFQTYPRIKNVGVEVESFNILNIKIEEREAEAKWCAAIRCYLVDTTGYIFSEYVEPSEGTLVVEDVGKLPVFVGMDDLIGSEAIGKYILTGDLYKKSIHAIQEMKKMGYAVNEVHVFSRDEILFKVEGNGNIIFSDRKPFDVSLSNLASSLTSEAISSSTKFEYIDVRFGNKVFYKLDKNNQQVSSSSASTSSKRR